MNIYLKLAELTHFETTRLMLRPVSLEDAPAMFDYTCNPDNLRFLFTPHKLLDETRLSIANHFMKNPLGKWGISLKNDDKLLGTIRFIKLSEKDQTAEIGYVLNQKFWNQGILTEALSALTEQAFTHLDLKKLTLRIDKANLASKRVAEKVGYRPVSQQKAANQYTGKITIFEMHELTKHEFRQKIGAENVKA